MQDITRRILAVWILETGTLWDAGLIYEVRLCFAQWAWAAMAMVGELL